MAGGKPEKDKQKLIAFLVDFDSCAIDGYGFPFSLLVEKIVSIVQANTGAQFKVICFSQRQDVFHEHNAQNYFHSSHLASIGLPALVKAVNARLATLKKTDKVEFDPVLLADFYENLAPNSTHDSKLRAFATEPAEDSVFETCPTGVGDAAKISFTYAFTNYLVSHDGPVETYIFDDQRNRILVPNYVVYQGNEGADLPKVSIQLVDCNSVAKHCDEAGECINGSGLRDVNFARTLQRLAFLHGCSIRAGCSDDGTVLYAESYPFDILRKDSFEPEELSPEVFPEAKTYVAEIRRIESTTKTLSTFQTSNSNIPMNVDSLDLIKSILHLGLRCYRIGLVSVAKCLTLFIVNLVNLLLIPIDSNQLDEFKGGLSQFIQSVKQECIEAINSENSALEAPASEKNLPAKKVSYDFVGDIRKLHAGLIGDSLSLTAMIPSPQEIPPQETPQSEHTCQESPHKASPHQQTY